MFVEAWIVEEEDRHGKKSRKPVFPRYHQLDATRKLAALDLAERDEPVEQRLQALVEIALDEVAEQAGQEERAGGQRGDDPQRRDQHQPEGERAAARAQERLAEPRSQRRHPGLASLAAAPGALRR